MQEGFVADAGDRGRLRRTRWTEGRPGKNLFGGLSVRGLRQIDAVTFRCPKCGWLIWFAPESAESDA
jgi:hypothetical protein